jgi:hypothetical protein|tara:strand:+ start:2624 stop:2728 length:105 start_codon:yes stop_codon:yes gene_type:complete
VAKKPKTTKTKAKKGRTKLGKPAKRKVKGGARGY